MAAIKRNPGLHRAIFIVTILGFQIFDTLAWMWAGQQAAVEVSFGTLAVNVVACAVLILLTSGFGAFSNVNEASLQAFRQDVTNKQLLVLVNNKVVSALAQEASRNLHGRVQTRLLSCAAAIDRATASGDIDLLNRALIEVNDIFDDASLVQPEEPVLPLGQQLAKISKHWDGLCEVNLNLDKSIEGLATKTASDIADIVEEAITNAARHGKSTQADIRVQDFGSKVSITVSDNGLFATDGAPGVGTELIRLLTRGDFSLTKNALGGATLRANLLKAGY
jgi:signal transduction histidine kinase